MPRAVSANQLVGTTCVSQYVCIGSFHHLLVRSEIEMFLYCVVEHIFYIRREENGNRQEREENSTTDFSFFKTIL